MSQSFNNEGNQICFKVHSNESLTLMHEILHMKGFTFTEGSVGGHSEYFIVDIDKKLFCCGYNSTIKWVHTIEDVMGIINAK